VTTDLGGDCPFTSVKQGQEIGPCTFQTHDFKDTVFTVSLTTSPPLINTLVTVVGNYKTK